MNWNLFINLLNTFSFMYLIVFATADTAAGMLRSLHMIKPAKYENLYWRAVSLFRFLRPVRYAMWVILSVTGLLASEVNGWTYFTIIIYGILCFVNKDHHDDDPRQKKPSKVLSAIKSLGHRLVVVPQ